MRLFYELMQVALGTWKRLSRVPSVREWEAVYDEAERQAVVGVFLEGLQWCIVHDEGCMANLPIDLKLQWIGEVQMMEAEYRQHSTYITQHPHHRRSKLPKTNAPQHS